MGVPHATIIMSVEVNRRYMQLKRELENGYFQHVEMPLPALLTMQSGSNKLRYATLMGIKKAKTKEVRHSYRGGIWAASSEPAIRSSASICRSDRNNRRSSTGQPREAAAKLVEKLKFEASVL